MRLLRTLLVLGVISAIPLAAFAAGAADTKTNAKAPVTVADFAVMLTHVNGSDRSLDADRAVASLLKAGVPLGDPKAPLNEGKLAEILTYYGVHATTDEPGKAVGADRAQAATLLLPASLNEAASTKVPPSVNTLDDCLAQSNHGQCVGCCKALGGTAKSCSRTCFQINKPSESEPLP